MGLATRSDAGTGRVAVLRVGRAGAISLSRNFLHAAELSFSHPRTGEKLALQAPLPPALQGFLDALNKNP